MAQKRPLYERVDAAIAEGKLWRAKEMLQGNVGTRGYDLELYERYGALLLSMGDDVEAGRYLFLSGARRPEYAEAIELYVRRYSHADFRYLLGTFPYSARRSNLTLYPEAVQTELRALGVRNCHLVAATESSWTRAEEKETLGQKACLVGCLGVALFLVICLLVGIFVVLGWATGGF